MFGIRVETIRSAADTIYVFDTDLGDKIRFRYNTHIHHLRFQNQESFVSTTNVNNVNVLG